MRPSTAEAGPAINIDAETFRATPITRIGPSARPETPWKADVLSRPARGVIQRCDDGVDCAASEAESLSLQRTAAGVAASEDVPASVHETLRDRGQPLESAARAMFEERFGHDFGDVRVHTGALASASARAVAARAYTVGRDIVFGAGAYVPTGHEGHRLLAHELAHVVQQRRVAGGAPTEISRTDDPAEREAQTTASSVLGAKRPATPPAMFATAAPGRLARQVEEQEAVEVLATNETDIGEASDGDAAVVGLSPGGMPTAMLAQLDPPGGASVAEPMQSRGKAGRGRKRPEDRWITIIDVDLSAQELTVTWSDGATEGPHPISSGRGLPNTKEDPCKTQAEKNCTPVGSFKAGRKGDAKTTNSHGDAMAWYLGFVDDRGIGIHDSQPVPKGTPRSHGCVRVGDSEADMAFAERLNRNSRTGDTVINVHGKAPTKPWTKTVPRRRQR
jgi:hypothetical protein